MIKELNERLGFKLREVPKFGNCKSYSGNDVISTLPTFYARSQYGISFSLGIVLGYEEDGEIFPSFVSTVKDSQQQVNYVYEVEAILDSAFLCARALNPKIETWNDKRRSYCKIELDNIDFLNTTKNVAGCCRFNRWKTPSWLIKDTFHHLETILTFEKTGSYNSPNKGLQYELPKFIKDLYHLELRPLLVRPNSRDNNERRCE